MTRARVLVIDDKKNILRLFEKMLGDSHEVTTADDGAKGLALIGTMNFDVIITDIRMPKVDGLAILRAVKATRSLTEVIVMTAYASIETAVETIRQGAYDYIEKPFDPERVQRTVDRAVERKRLREQAANLRRELEERNGPHDIVGKSAAMKRTFRLLRRASELDISVLLTGETGTGKEVAARAIHGMSHRAQASFVSVNCGALPSALVESELFGHARGAFTGARSAKPGLFEEADGGTLFLDEIGDLPLEVQVKLNPALQDREIRRVGENVLRQVDVRVIAATHRDLRAEAQAGRFREDLFYRLNVFPVVMPALRDKVEDIPLLLFHFMQKYARIHKRNVKHISAEAMRALSVYPWPGNVREFEHAIERAVAVAEGDTIDLEGLPFETTQVLRGTPRAQRVSIALPYREAMAAIKDEMSFEYLTALMREFDGNVTQAALHAGMERESLHRLLKKTGIRASNHKGQE